VNDILFVRVLGEKSYAKLDDVVVGCHLPPGKPHTALPWALGNVGEIWRNAKKAHIQYCTIPYK
jgi:hypothetical protein